MDETETGGRQLNVAEANALAQELNDIAAGREPGDETWRGGDVAARPVESSSEAGPSPEAATAGYKPLEAEEREARAGVYPPDVAPTVDVGGSPEMQAQLAEEYRQDDERGRGS